MQGLCTLPEGLREHCWNVRPGLNMRCIETLGTIEQAMSLEQASLQMNLHHPGTSCALPVIRAMPWGVLQR